MVDVHREHRRAFMIGYFRRSATGAVAYVELSRPFLGTGVCGGFTTFSTMRVEILAMIEHQRYWLAATYIVASIGLGLLAVYAATALVRRAELIR